jgi:protoporphyrinogen oxidase
MPADILVVGAGPSGLAAAYEALRHNAGVTVIERLDRVGGLCRTMEFGGARFDVGPHRFFTKNAEVNALFHGLLAEDAIRVRRRTRILHGQTFFDYPLTPLNAASGVGLLAGTRIAGSYVAARLRNAVRPRQAETFEDWIVGNFGRQLFETFFRVYTEKVWGIPCRQIGAEWAAQRIKGLSLATAIRNAVTGSGTSRIKTLIDEFSYPRLGAGQTYEKMAASIALSGGRVLTRSRVQKLRREDGTVRAAVIEDEKGGRTEIEAGYFLTSATLTDTLAMLDPPPPQGVLDACRALRYRDHIGVNIIASGPAFPDNWIYVHSPDVELSRVSNYRNFSVEMAGDANISPITAEYFSFPGDHLSRMNDAGLIEKAVGELRKLALLDREAILGAFVVRSESAYPVIEIGYERNMAVIRAWLDGLKNLLPIGRSGMFKYNNQDHAIATGTLAARRALGLGRLDPWLVNIDAEYHEAVIYPGASQSVTPVRRA